VTVEPDGGAAPDAGAAPGDSAPVPALGPCMDAASAVAWARGEGAGAVAEALAGHLTDRRPASAPEVPPEAVALRIRSIDAAPLLDAECASLVVAFAAGPDEGPEVGAIAVFAPALTEPRVFWSGAADADTDCRARDVRDVDADGRFEMLVEETSPGRPARLTLYGFPDDAAPLPLWVSDDDPVRRALFDDDAEDGSANRLDAAAVSFERDGGTSRLRVEYRWSACGRGGTDGGDDCEPAGAQTLVFTRAGDVYLLPGEPEPGAPWGRPGNAEEEEGGEEGEEGAAEDP
jgi:hypothetical protein